MIIRQQTQRAWGRIFLLSSLLMLLLVVPCLAQHTQCSAGETASLVRGKVESPAGNGRIMPAANVQVTLIRAPAKTVARAITDRDGMYYFSNVPCGRYQLRVSGNEYAVRVLTRPHTDLPKIRLRGSVRSGTRLDADKHKRALWA